MTDNTYDHYFHAPLRGRLMLVTYVSLVLMGVLPLVLAIVFYHGFQDSVTHIAGIMAAVVAVFWASLALSYAFSPQGFHLESEGLVIDRLVSKVVIPYTDITCVRDEIPCELGFSSLTFQKVNAPGSAVGLWSSQGLFGVYGTFWSKERGLFNIYVKNENAVCLQRSDDRLVVVSPDRPDEFVARLRERLT